ncbi:MAG: hypothetical protein H0V07_09720 [Propionibacteriales bacterium]|nr:hypothetical protein [Propionibacteriales bacterium]
MTPTPARWALPLVAAMTLQVAACSHDPNTSQAKPDMTSSDQEATGTSDAEPTWTLLADEPENVPLEAGAYGLTVNGAARELAVIEAPEGFMNYGGWTFISGEPFHAVGYVTADRVFRDPCGSTRRSKYDTARDPGPTVADLAEALVAQKRARRSEPAPVTVDGHAGLYLEYRVSNEVDVADCEDRAFDIFTTGPGGWYLEASRERAAIWILDVDGDRVVLAWVGVPGVTREQINEMTHMVESTRFVDPR